VQGLEDLILKQELKKATSPCNSESLGEAMANKLRVQADVYEDVPISILDHKVVEYSIRLGRYGAVEDAYWHVSILPVDADNPPGQLQVTEQWFEIDSNGFRRLHYVVANDTPGPFSGTYCKFVRKLVRIPAA
jgi:hypothetical protein